MHITKVKDYNKVLDKNKIREFTRAIGLAASGVGIGSFVYLRRVFEYLLEEAHTRAKTETGWIDDNYYQARVDEKIALLKQYLPEFLVSNKIMYGILSKGIHELKEEECLNYFESLKNGIEMILDEKVEMYSKKIKLEKAKQAISLINQSIEIPHKN